MEFSLPERVEGGILERCRRASPAEACGLLLGSCDGGLLGIELSVESANLEGRAPGRGPARFRLDPVAHLRAERVALDRGCRVLGCWHSHPGGEARPSVLDRVGLPPDWAQMIVGLGPGGRSCVRVWLSRGPQLLEALPRCGPGPGAAATGAPSRSGPAPGS